MPIKSFLKHYAICKMLISLWILLRNKANSWRSTLIFSVNISRYQIWRWI